MKQWKCAICGQIFEGEAPPVPCPVCSAGEDAFSLVSGGQDRWRCTVCGQVFDGAVPPVPCPVCGAGESAFVKEQAEESGFSLDTDDRFVIIGGGAAGLSAAKAIRKRNKTASIKLICGEGVIPYNRPALSDVVGDGLSFEAVVLEDFFWYEQNRIQLVCHAKAQQLDTENKQVKLSDNSTITYTKLLLATGATAFMPPVDTDGSVKICALRTFNDADYLFTNAKNKRAVIIGGGILGIEAAIALRERGCKVSVVELAPRLMAVQADEFASKKLSLALEKAGIKAYTNTQLTKIEQGTVFLENTEKISADIVLFCIGVRSDTALAKAAGLETERGIIITSNMQTSNSFVYAAGDCAQLNGRVSGLYSAAVAGGEAAGASMAGEEIDFQAPAAATAFEGLGITLFSAGDFNFDGTALVLTDNQKEIYKKLIYNNKVLKGAVLLGDTSGAAQIISAINQQQGYNFKL